MKALMTECRLEQICDFHKSISELINDFQLAPLSINFSKSLSERSLELLLELSPIQVFKKQKEEKYVCVGGIKQLMLARARLKPEHTIHVLLYQGTRLTEKEVKKLKERVVVELYQQPALMSMSQNDTNMIKNTARSLDELGKPFLKELGIDTDELQSCWSGVSERTIGRARKRK